MDKTLQCKSLADLGDLDEEIAAVLEIVVDAARRSSWPEAQYWIRIAASFGGQEIRRLDRRPRGRREWIALMARARSVARALRRDAQELRAINSGMLSAHG